MPTKNVNLSEKQARFVRQNIEEGNYRNASEVVRAGLRLLEQQEKENKLKLATLRRLAKEAFDEIDRGEFEMIQAGDIDAFLARIDAKVRRPRRASNCDSQNARLAISSRF
jgi:antitoxin ParD1/3/4